MDDSSANHVSGAHAAGASVDAACCLLLVLALPAACGYRVDGVCDAVIHADYMPPLHTDAPPGTTTKVALTRPTLCGTCGPTLPELSTVCCSTFATRSR